MPMSLTLTRGALAVLEEVRRDPWQTKPIPSTDGLYHVCVATDVLKELHAVALANESTSDTILRAYRDGKFAQPLRSK